MPKLLVPTATKEEILNLNKRVYQYLYKKGISMFDLSVMVEIKQCLLHFKLNGRTKMRKIEYFKIEKAISE